MKNALYIINGILILAVGVLFYLYFSEKKPSSFLGANRNNTKEVVSSSGFKIGYFEWDSLERNFKQFKEIQDEIVQKDESNERQKMQWRSQYQNKLQGYQQKYQQQSLSQVESEEAARDLKNTEMDLTNRMQSLDNELSDFKVRKQNEIKTKIEDYLKEYNKEKGYSFIFAYEPALIFYKDTVYNITNDLVQGLNEKYPPAKKK